TLLSSSTQNMLQGDRNVFFPLHTRTSSADKEKNAHLFIIVIVVFYAAIAMALLLAYIKSRKLENKNDPYHIYIKKNWNVAEGARALESDRDSVEIEAPPLRPVNK
uniref:Potassium voltage-gated channel subfamily E member 2 n=1 Tax=Erpetoichthys calabaricus TaxID=27687 RepID=A0A8C4SPC1_ERPCA